MEGRILLGQDGRREIRDFPEIRWVQNHVLHAEVQHLINLSLIAKEVEVASVEAPGEVDIVLLLPRFLNEAVIGNTPGLKVEGEGKLALQAVEVIQADLGPLTRWHLQLVEDFFHTTHGLIEILTIEFNDLAGDLPSLHEVGIIEIR